MQCLIRSCISRAPTWASYPYNLYVIGTPEFNGVEGRSRFLLIREALGSEFHALRGAFQQ